MTKINQRASDSASISSVTYEVNSIGQHKKRTTTDATSASVITSSAGVSPASSTNYTPTAINQYTAISGGAFQASRPSYDDDGNDTAYPLPVITAANAALTYDVENRLIKVVTDSTT